MHIERTFTVLGLASGGPEAVALLARTVAAGEGDEEDALSLAQAIRDLGDDVLDEAFQRPLVERLLQHPESELRQAVNLRLIPLLVPKEQRTRHDPGRIEALEVQDPRVPRHARPSDPRS